MFIKQSKYENVSFNFQARVGLYLSRIDVLRSTSQPRLNLKSSQSRLPDGRLACRRFPHPFGPARSSSRTTCRISAGLPDITMIPVHWAMFGLPLYSTVCMSVVCGGGCSLGSCVVKVGCLPDAMLMRSCRSWVTLVWTPMYRNVMD